MGISLRIAVSLLSVTGLLVNSANAQVIASADCTCVTAPVKSSTSTLGNISLLNGDVLYSGPNGFEIATPGAKLVSGSQITVGKNASADISVGSSCNLKIPANSEATISQPLGQGSEICVKVSEPLITAAFDTGASSQAPTVAPLVPLLVIGGVVGLAIILGGGDGAASN